MRARACSSGDTLIIDIEMGHDTNAMAGRTDGEDIDPDVSQRIDHLCQDGPW